MRYDVVFSAPSTIAPNGMPVVLSPDAAQQEVLAMCTKGTWRDTTVGPTAMTVLADPATLQVAFPTAVTIGSWEFDEGEIGPGLVRARVSWDQAMYLEAQPLVAVYDNGTPTWQPVAFPIQASTWPTQRPRDLA